jgi:hypothetical protein
VLAAACCKKRSTPPLAWVLLTMPCYLHTHHTHPLRATSQERDANLKPGFQKQSMWGSIDSAIKDNTQQQQQQQQGATDGDAKPAQDSQRQQ